MFSISLIHFSVVYILLFAAKKVHFSSVLVHPGYYNKIPDLEVYKQQKFIVHSSGGCKSEIMVPAWSGEDPFLGHGLFIMSLYGRWSKGAQWDNLYKGTNPTHEGSTLMTSSPPKGPTS